jgi:hypothetical protein
MVNDKVISFLKTHGPSLPVEIGKEIGYNSFITKAILLELINEGKVKKSKRTIGGSLVYYLEGQENAMRKRIFEEIGIPDKKVLKMLKEKGSVLVSDMSPHERAFIKELRDFISVEKKEEDFLISHHAYVPEKEKIPETRTEPKRLEPLFKKEVKADPKEKVPEQQELSDFERIVTRYLNTIGEIVSKEKVRKDSEYDYALKVTNPFPQELFVKAKSKKRVNEKDLSIVYAEAMKRKQPALLVITGSLTKKAREWKDKGVGGLVKVVKIK